MNDNSTWFYKLVYRTYSKILIRKNKLLLVNNVGADLENGPYFLICNHVGILDPVIISSLFPLRTIRWVTGAYLFKNRLLKHLFSYHLKCIPKQQGRGDLSTVRAMQKNLKEGHIVGIYPEGTRSWDGDTIELGYTALAKMVKKFDTTVLFVHSEGGYAHNPRWASFSRKGSVTVNVKHIITKQETEDYSIDDLADKIEKYFAFSNDKWKTKENYQYESSRRAEGIQRLFYMCPVCKKVECIQSDGNRFWCTNCHASGYLNSMDNIVSTSFPFKTISKWHLWESWNICSCKTFKSEKGVLFQTGDNDNNGVLTTVSENIEVKLVDNSIFVTDCNNQKQWELPLDRITSLILNAKQTMELFCDDVLYRIRLLPDASSLKYQEFYKQYKLERTEEN